SDVSVVDEPKEALAQLRRRRRPAAVLEVAHLDDEAEVIQALAALQPSELAEPVPGRVLEYGLDELVLEVDAPARGVVVIAEGHDEGWQAWVDGEPASVHRVNLVFRAVVVEAGTHRIELRYRPPGVVPLWALWWLGWLGIAAVAVRDRVLRSRARGS